MKQPKLFDIPAQQTRLKKFKEIHQIQSHRSAGMTPPWTALHLPTGRAVAKPYGGTDKSDMFECMAHVCRLLDEAGLVGYGDTEKEAVANAAAAAKIQVLPSDF